MLGNAVCPLIDLMKAAFCLWAQCLI